MVKAQSTNREKARLRVMIFVMALSFSLARSLRFLDNFRPKAMGENVPVDDVGGGGGGGGGGDGIVDDESPSIVSSSSSSSSSS